MESYGFTYLDDIILVGRSLQEHLDNREVFRRLRTAILRLNKAKCRFFQKTINYLKHQVSKGGINTDATKIAAIKEVQLQRMLKSYEAV